MACTLESIAVVIDDDEMSIAEVNGVPHQFGAFILGVYDIGDDDPSFTLDKARSRLLEEETRSALPGERAYQPGRLPSFRERSCQSDTAHTAIVSATLSHIAWNNMAVQEDRMST